MAISSVRIYVYHAMISLNQLSDSGVLKGLYRCLTGMMFCMLELFFEGELCCLLSGD